VKLAHGTLWLCGLRAYGLSDEHLAEWEAKINSMQPAKASRTASKQKVAEMTGDDAANKEDCVEPGMTLPASALNQCLESFTAADGNHIKASTQKFNSTSVMVLLCQHDQAIFLANMVTAGEKQFYAYALIAALLRELPEHWKVSLLYDVTCALQWSLVKWQFMPEWLN
jgi:Kyakuja-Dileera-Zisupton transposase